MQYDTHYWNHHVDNRDRKQQTRLPRYQVVIITVLRLVHHLHTREYKSFVQHQSRVYHYDMRHWIMHNLPESESLIHSLCPLVDLILFDLDYHIVFSVSMLLLLSSLHVPYTRKIYPFKVPSSQHPPTLSTPLICCLLGCLWKV